MDKKCKITILRPAGNDTALAEGIPVKKDRKKINDKIMRLFPNVEQVGFYKFNQKNGTGTLEMAGGEFCGNALRSLAYLLLKGKKGEISFKTSGTDQTLKAGSVKKDSSYAQMPIIKSFDSVKTIDDKICLVEIEGITHLITKKPNVENINDLKTLGKNILEDNNLLLTYPASGVMFTSFENGKLRVDPIVWVRDIKTLFYETACASGTTALGLWIAKGKESSKLQAEILQPSGSTLIVNITKNKEEFEEAYINGPITILFEGGVKL